MPQADFRSPRLFVDAPFAADATISLDRNQSNYLGNVLRLGSGASVLVFNGKDGEWQAAISGGKRADRLTLLTQVRPQDYPARRDLCIRPAETRPARLHGPEGHRNGRGGTAAGDDALYPGQPGEYRADARQCGRGGRTMRNSERGQRRRTAEPAQISRPAGCQAAADLLRRGRRSGRSHGRADRRPDGRLAPESTS